MEKSVKIIRITLWGIFILFILVVIVPLFTGDRTPDYEVCTGGSMESRAIKTKNVLDEAGVDVTFSMDYQEVTVNRNHIVWISAFENQTFDVKKGLTLNLAVYNNCVNRKQNSGDVTDSYLIELRDAHTDKKFASIGPFSGFKLHD